MLRRSINGILMVSLCVLGCRSLQASNYYERKGSFNHGEIKLLVSWVDVYNMRPQKRHFSSTKFRVIPDEELQSPGYCKLTVAGKDYQFNDNALEIQQKHIRGFYISCNFKSAINKHRTSMQGFFEVKHQRNKDQGPFDGYLIIQPAGQAPRN